MLTGQLKKRVKKKERGWREKNERERKRERKR